MRPELLPNHDLLGNASSKFKQQTAKHETEGCSPDEIRGANTEDTKKTTFTRHPPSGGKQLVTFGIPASKHVKTPGNASNSVAMFVKNSIGTIREDSSSPKYA